ncbi:MAG: hypothetical protein OJF50_006229 [Nitrospira sp.]|jgi:hypothetical protein|nr:hypothetical protein [Nitrospira sp.]
MLIPDDKTIRNKMPLEHRHEGMSFQASPSSPKAMVNVLPAQVAAIYRGLMRVGIRVRVGERTNLAVRLPLDHRLANALSAGQWVKALIPSEAVQLEAGYFRLGKRRWNRWIGNVLRVESLSGERLVTVGLHNDQLLLTSCGPIMGSDHYPQTWDTVNVVVDPTRITLEVASVATPTWSQTEERAMSDSPSDSRVWLRARIVEVGEVPEGRLLSLLVGSARVSALVGSESDSFGQWVPGMAVEIHVGRYEAWLKPRGIGCPPVLCGILYLDQHALGGAR